MEASSSFRGRSEPSRVLEFYSGIGGMRYSMMKAGLSASVVEAFEINDSANDVYEHNFDHRPYQSLVSIKFVKIYESSFNDGQVFLSQGHGRVLLKYLNIYHGLYHPQVTHSSFLSVFPFDCLVDQLTRQRLVEQRSRVGNIGSLTVADLDKYGAHAWLLSPPCQPYTRQGLQRDADDARALSFLKILDLLPQMKEAPLMVFVENVVGFEKSETQKRLSRSLQNAGFVTQEYILSPLQFGVPYSRPRYFCLAKRYPLSFANPQLNNQLLETHHHFRLCEENDWVESLEVAGASCKPISEFLETWEIVSANASALPHNRTNGFEHVFEGGLDDIKSFQHSDKVGYESKDHKESVSVENKLDQFAVPSSLVERFGGSMDIVFPESRRCCCFTKSYYRYVKGTGSLLATVQVHSLQGKPAVSLLHQIGLRYFTPREVANLHSFPQEFEFPQHISLRQRYALLGNSLSIAVVAPLLRYLFTEPLQ